MKYVITDKGNIILIIQGCTYTISPSHIRYNQIKDLIKSPECDEDKLLDNVEFKEECEANGITVTARGVYVEGKFDSLGRKLLNKGFSLGNIALRKNLEALDPTTKFEEDPEDEDI